MAQLSHISLSGYVLYTIRLTQPAPVDLTDHVGPLRVCLRRVMARHPFQIDSGVVLPDRLHMIWHLPRGADPDLRWRLIKSGMSRHLRRLNPTLGVDQPRRRDLGFWRAGQGARLIHSRSDLDICRQVVWASPVVAGLVRRTVDWPYSSIHRSLARRPIPRAMRPTAKRFDLPEILPPEAPTHRPCTPV